MIEQLRVALWVRVLDALTILLTLLAAVIALSGGFRVHVGGMRVGVTTPLPLLFWSLAIELSGISRCPANRSIESSRAG